MIYIALSIACSVGILFLFRIFDRFDVNTRHAIMTNYGVAGALPQRWPGVGSWLTVGLVLIVGLAFCSVLVDLKPVGHGLPVALGLASAGLLLVNRLAFDVEQRRVLADVCLLTPLLVWPWL